MALPMTSMEAVALVPVTGVPVGSVPAKAVAITLDVVLLTWPAAVGCTVKDTVQLAPGASTPPLNEMVLELMLTVPPHCVGANVVTENEAGKGSVKETF